MTDPLDDPIIRCGMFTAVVFLSAFLGIIVLSIFGVWHGTR